MSTEHVIDLWKSMLPTHLAAVLLPERVSAQVAAAKGFLPCPPNELVVLLCALRAVGQPDLQDTATATLQSMPTELVCKQVVALRHPAVLEVLSSVFATQHDILAALILNPLTPDTALVALAEGLPLDLAQLLIDNQSRCLRTPDLVRALVHNVHVDARQFDPLFDFLVRQNAPLTDLSQFADAYARLSLQETAHLAAEVVLPDTALGLLIEDADKSDSAKTAPEEGPSEVQDLSVLSDIVTEDEPLSNTKPEKQLPVLKLINSMNMAQKVALATRGNKEARSILLRDANRVVALAAIKNPRISDQEIQAAARSRSVHDDVIRVIANSKDMTRGYATKLALVQNPKTPLPIALRMLPAMRAVDLKAIAKSKGLPQVLVVQAQKLLRSKEGAG